MLRKELQGRLGERGWAAGRADVIRGLGGLQEIELDKQGKRFVLCTEAQGAAAKVCQAAGVALPPTARQVEP